MQLDAGARLMTAGDVARCLGDARLLDACFTARHVVQLCMAAAFGDAAAPDALGHELWHDGVGAAAAQGPTGADGTLSDLERRQLDIHLAQCQACRDEVTAIRELLAPHVAEPQPEEEAEPEADLASQAQALIDAGQPQEAIALLQPALQAETDDALLLLLARALLADGQLDDADKVINAVQQKDSHKQTLNALKAQLSFARQTTDFAPRDTLLGRLDADANDSEARYQLALLDLTAGASEPALAALLDLLQSDRSWGDGAAQKTLLQVFDVLGGDHPLTVQYRRKLYQALY